MTQWCLQAPQDWGHSLEWVRLCAKRFRSIHASLLDFGSDSHIGNVRVCCKPKPPEPLSIEEVEAARQHFNRHPNGDHWCWFNGHPTYRIQNERNDEPNGATRQKRILNGTKIPNLYYIRISLSGTGVFERGYDGEQFWERTPRGSRFLSKDEVLSLQATIDFQRWKNHTQWYPTIVSVVEVDFGGELCTAVKSTTHDGREETSFFAQSTGLLLGIEKAGENPSIIRYGQYLYQGISKCRPTGKKKIGDVHKIWRVEQSGGIATKSISDHHQSLLEER